MRYVISPHSKERVYSFILDTLKRSRLLATLLECSLKRIGRHCVTHNLGPRISRREARRALMSGRLGKCRDTARHHIDLLIEAGELIPCGAHLVLRSFRGVVGEGGVKQMMRAPEFWALRHEAKLARRRANDTRRRAKKRRKIADQIGKTVAKRATKTKRYTAGRCAVKDSAAGAAAAAATPGALSFTYSRLRAQKPRPRPATKAPVVLPTPAPTPTPVFVAACAPQDTPEAIAQARAAFMALPRVKPPPPVDDAPGDDTGLTDLGRLLGRALDVAESAAPKPPPPAPVPQLLTARELAIARLAQQRGIAGLNVRAIANTGAPLPIIVQAMGAVVDKGKRVRNPPAFCYGTVRRWMIQARP